MCIIKLLQSVSFDILLQQEGTLMGTAFATCFGYWFGIAGLLWIVCYVCNTRIGMIQLLNVLVSYPKFIS